MTPPLILILALIAVESGGDESHLGDDGAAVGCLQIHAGVVADVNRHYRPWQYLLTDRFRHDRSVEILVRYLAIYASRKHLGREPTVEDMARIWNRGPDGWKDPRTIPYWRKVQKAMKKIQSCGS